VGTILEKRVGYDDPIGRRKYEIQSVRARALEGEDK
jgi:[NiFe] hydrogenase diaphorase moiety small subunit